MDTPTLAWHFCGRTLRDGRPIPPDGEWLVHDNWVEICICGLHASIRLIDALRYAPGSTICRVAVGDIVEQATDKLVTRRRAILWRLPDADKILRAFARKAALSVIHLWDAPEIVRRYLETGDESIRIAADVAAYASPTTARAAATAHAHAAAAAHAAATAYAHAAAAAAAAAADAYAYAASTAAATARNIAAWDATLGELNSTLEALVTEAASNPDTDALLAQAIEILARSKPAKGET